MQIENMKIWADNWKTDPKYTKLVKYGSREFTAISAQYKIERMTQYFGACGIGWGFTRHFKIEGLPEYPTTNHVVCDLLLWYTLPDDTTRHEVPSIGSAELYQGKDGRYRPDTDAWKKAETDALTKAFSRLGFFADVFLGMYDDEKYIEFLHENPPEPGKLKTNNRKPDKTLHYAESILENAICLVPENEKAESLAISASLCFEMCGLGSRFVDRVRTERGIKWNDHDAAKWLYERGIEILETMISGYILAGGDPNADWMYHAKQVAQLAMGDVESIDLLLEDAALPLFRRQP